MYTSHFIIKTEVINDETSYVWQADQSRLESYLGNKHFCLLSWSKKEKKMEMSFV